MTISKTTLETLVADIAATAEVWANKVISWSATTKDTNYPSEKLVKDSLDNKVDKVNGKGLSTNDYTTNDKNLVEGASATPGASILPVSDGSGKLDGWINDGSTSTKGKVQLATYTETTTGTDTAKTLTPSGFSHSDYGKRSMQVKILDDSTLLTTGEGKLILCIQSEFNGYNLVGAQAYVTTPSSSGLPSIGIRNVTDAVEMLSVNITINVSGYTSYAATTPPTIDTAHGDVATGDLIAVDIDTAGTGTKGLGVILSFQLP